jgi:ribosomal protein S18 acetylase RimI-like enzyme
VIRIRQAGVADAAALAELWRAAGLDDRPADAVAGELADMAARNPELLLAATDDDGRVVGSVIAGFDGRRGWVNRLAVAAERRGEGIARRLMDRVEAELAAKGCRKVNLMVRRDNARVVAFYRQRGFEPDDVVFLGKWLRRPGG